MRVEVSPNLSNRWRERERPWAWMRIFLEVHDRPERALSDGSNALRLDRLPDLLAKLTPIAKLVRSWSAS